jgi:ketosteroid isomerase-like protein
MATADVEVVKQVWDVFRRGGFPDDALAEDIEWHRASDEPEATPGVPLRGPDEVAEMLASSWETVVDAWVEVDEFIAAGDRVVVCWRGGGNGRVSGVPVEWHETHTYLVRDGKIAEVREYRTKEEALEASPSADD